ncbi:MAG: hypothetical protein HQK76_04675 [Desulfobacterales bacterium]|nr:hypothetical protein [Desulfobacterales bacterium]
MSEIKSTLDMVMERTKHLDLSGEEKKEQAINEFKKNLRGLVQKLLDNILNIEKFYNELNKLKKIYGSIDEKKLLKTEILDRIGLETDNKQTYFLLKELCQIEPNNIKSIISAYIKEIKVITEKIALKIHKKLAQVNFISGSSIVPNVYINREWQENIKEIKKDYNKRINETKQNLIVL